MAKPAHPAIVHFPIAFLALAFGLDLFQTASPNLPIKWQASLPPSADITRASYYLLSLGLITAIPALVSGIREAGVQVNKGGLYESDATGSSVKLREKFKPMIAHALINDIQLGLATLVWYKKRAAAKNTLAGKLGLGSASTAAAAYQAETWMLVTEGFCFLFLMMAANAGGVLVFNFGMGLTAGGAGSKKKV